MSPAPNPPMPNPRECEGFLVTISLPSILFASQLRPGDTFALPENADQRLTVESAAPHPTHPQRLIITVDGDAAPLTLHVDEPIRPLRMPRTISLTCQLCTQRTKIDLDLVLHGEPQTWVCNRH